MVVDGNILIGYGFLLPSMGKGIDGVWLGSLSNYFSHWWKNPEQCGNWQIYQDDRCFAKDQWFTLVVHKQTVIRKIMQTGGNGGFGLQFDKLPIITPEIQEEAIKVYEILSGHFNVSKPKWCVYTFDQ
jgi:hypothetical protein